MKFWNIFLVLVICTALSFVVACSDDDDDDPVPTELKIAALIPESGGYSDTGVDIKAAIELAVVDANAEFEADNLNVNFDVIVSDTQTDPAISSALVNTYLDQSFRFIIGPITSAEVLSVRDAINGSQSILISPSSTMIDLAVADDNIYRIVPDDSKMVEATVEAMVSKGITDLAIINVGTSWGVSLLDQMESQFTAAGGNFLGAVEFFGARPSEIGDALDSLKTIMDLYLESGNADNAAIQLISFDAGSVVCDTAYGNTTLEQFKWFGTDGFVNNSVIINDFPDAAAFASMVEYTAPIFGVESTDSYAAVADRIETATGNTPGVYPILAYDAVMSAAKALQAEGQDATLDNLKTKLSTVLADNPGVTGNIVLNDACDRDSGKYYFWTLVESGSTYTWEHSMTFSDGSIIDN